MSAEIKVANYSAEQVEVLKAGYEAGESIEALAAKVGKTVRSVIAKLSKEGVYKAKAKEAELLAQFRNPVAAAAAKAA